MKILVTGGAGYIGSVLVGRLLARGWEVTVLDNLYHGVHGLFGYCSAPGFRFVRGDARDEATMRELMVDADVVIPLAALVGMPLCKRDPVTAKAINTDAVRLILELRSSQQRVIYPCTNSGYGTQTGEVHCTEDTALEPISLYGQTKVEGEKAVLDAGNSVTFRFATIFGVSPRMRMDLLVNDFVHRAVTDGCLVLYQQHFKRNYLHIEDAADVFVHAIDNFDAMVGKAYNCGNDEANCSKRELAEHIKQHVPRLYIHAAEIGEDPDKRDYVVSNERLRQAGFEARRGLDEGIRQLITAYQMLPPTGLANV